jgi:copper chaperone CopZ
MARIFVVNGAAALTLVAGATETGSIELDFDTGSDQVPNLDGFASVSVLFESIAGGDLTPIVITALKRFKRDGAIRTQTVTKATTIEAAYTMVDEGEDNFALEFPFPGCAGFSIGFDISGMTATHSVRFTASLNYS